MRISKEGIKPKFEAVKTIERLNRPSNEKELQALLGVCNYFQRFIKNFAHSTAPVYELLKKNATWEWTDRCENSFNELKSKLANMGQMFHPKEEGSYILYCDASDYAVGASLSQQLNGTEYPISFASQS